MADLPTGTVTLLFTDIEGSTRLLDELGERYADVLGEHRRVLREAFRQHGGVEVDTQGDAFFYAFPTASGALAAAAEGQAALAGGTVRVRVGIHTGEPLLTDEGYVGVDVHRAARIMSAGHGGQVLVSEQTARLVDGVPLRDLGEHRLKDMSAPQRLYQLADGDFAPLKTLDATNLPLATGPLFGRERELGELVALLSDGHRLVTLTGPGGTGKTRLALQVASELVGTLRDGVFWVPLAPLSDPQLVIPAIGQTLGAEGNVSGYLRDRKLLLLLDNAEHLLAAAPEVSELLAGAAGLRLLVTSRGPLHVAAEHEYELDPLPPSDAVTLFCERARAVGRELSPDETIAAICRRLDGLPLAVELAASRAKLLDPESLLSRLDRRLPLLTGGTRDAPERQRTLAATIGWSHDLASPEQQELFRRLAVFAGGCSLDAAEQVCAADLDALAALVDLSLLKAVGDARFLMLETIREYATERLHECGEESVIRRRHAEHFADLAERADQAREQLDGGGAVGLLELEEANLRAAMGWARAEGDGTLLLRLAVFADEIWLRGSQRDLRELLEEGLRFGTDEIDVRGRGEASLGFVTYRQGDYSVSRASSERALAVARETSNLRLVGMALNQLASVASGEERFDEASRFQEEAADAFRTAGLARNLATNLVNFGDIKLRMGEYERALELTEEALELLGGSDDRMVMSVATLNLAIAATRLGRLEQAAQHARTSLDLARELDDVHGTACCLVVFALIALERGHGVPAGRLLAAADVMWDAIVSAPEPTEQVVHDDVAQRLGQVLTWEERRRADEEGRALSPDEAVSEALAHA